MNMKRATQLIIAAVLSAGSLAYALTAEPQKVDPAEEISDIPALPGTPAPVDGLLYARPFKLAEGYEYEWRAERPMVRAGWLVVLQVNPALVFPRQTAEPILYAHKTTAERINLGYQSGRVVAIIPSELDQDGNLALDLSKAMMWFGTPGLPEQVDAARIEHERILARRAKIAPLAQDAINAATAKGGAMLNANNRAALRAAAAELIKTHAPQEQELIDAILAESTPVPPPPSPAK